MIKVLFFAQLADYAQADSIELEYEDGLTIRRLVNKMKSTLPEKLIDALQYDDAMPSINKVIASWDENLSDGDEVAFLPPFSGG